MKNNITGRVNIIIDAPVSKVWEALTKPEIIKQYFFGTDTHTDWKVGNPIRFTGEWQGKKYEDKGTILNFEPNKQIKYSYWSSMSGIEDKPENYVTVTYDLARNDEDTMVTITQDNIPDEKMKEHSEQNWGKVLTDLKTLLEKETVASL
ncbi:MAG TPA: SRPBCC family protein [Ferruginibacter sp.]|jgi:uncharacterized protein YndB with AHSA1/START domain|nr:SRPBCC family protein [Ferruginibacter sp.]